MDPGVLAGAGALAATHTYALASSVGPSGADIAAESPSIATYLTQPAQLVATLRTLPSGDAGRRLKRALLNALEDLAVESDQTLPADYSEIRRRVLAGEL